MKLIFCNKCKDVVQIRPEYRTCICGKSSCALVDGISHAMIYGEAIPLGIHNHSFAQAVIARPVEGMGVEFTAFVIAKINEAVKFDPMLKLE